jgi:hypothetical protein
MKSEQSWTNLQNGKAIDTDAHSGAESSENNAARECIEELLRYIEQQLAEVEQQINATVQSALGGAEATYEHAWSQTGQSC